jgi:hypothetical protein
MHETLNEEESLLLKTARSVSRSFGRSYWLEKWERKEPPDELRNEEVGRLLRFGGLKGCGYPCTRP